MSSDLRHALCFSLLLFCSCAPESARRPLLASPGLPAPELRLTELLQGPPPELRGWKDLGGRAAVLHFWAPRCSECADEIEAHNALASEFAGRALAFVHITDAGRDRAARFMKDHPVKGLVAPGGEPELFAAFRVYDLPCSVLVTASSEVFAFAGPGGVTKELISALLAGGPRPEEGHGPEVCRRAGAGQ